MRKEDRALRDILDGKNPEKKIMVSTADTTEAYEEIQRKREEQQKRAKERMEIFKDVRTPISCPVCGKGMRTKLDDKFWTLRKRCFECVVKEETKMRTLGIYEEYERRLIIENQLAWLRDQISSVEEWKEAPMPKFHNQIAADGSTLDDEKWSANREVLIKMANEALTDYKQEQDKLNSELDTIKVKMHEKGVAPFGGIFKD